MGKNDISIPSNKYVVEANDLSWAPSDPLTLNEQKIFLYAVSNIRKNDRKLKTQEIPLKIMIDTMNMNKDETYSRIVNLCDSMMSKFLKYIDEEGRVYKAKKIVSTMEYEKGVLKIKLSSDIKDYLLNLKEKFNKYHLYNVVQMSSRYAVRLYRILKAWEEQAKRKKESYVMYLKSIQERFGLLKYKSYTGRNAFGNIKNRVIIPAVDQINKYADIKISYDEIKKGRKKIGFKFYIKKQEASWQKKIEKEVTKQLFEIDNINFEDHPRKFIIKYLSRIADRDMIENYFEEVQINLLTPKTLQIRSKISVKTEKIQKLFGEEINKIAKEKKYKVEFV